MMKLFVCVIFACLLVAEAKGGKKPKQPKGVKQIKSICDANNASSLIVQDPAFYDIFEEIDGYCSTFYADLGEQPSGNNKTVDGVKTLLKVCKWYTKKYPEEPTEGPLVGLEELCNATAVAKKMSLNDKGSRKALAALTGLCEAEQAGTMEVANANFTEVFDDLSDFCSAFINETIITVEARGDGNVNGIKVLGKVCKWYTKKFDMDSAEGTLGGLTYICDDFQAVVEAEKEEEEEEEDED